MEERVGPPRPHIIETEIGDEISLYDPVEERVYVLNTTASDVWRLAEGDYTVEEIVQLLGRAYGVEPESIRGDVENTVTELKAGAILGGGGE